MSGKITRTELGSGLINELNQIGVLSGLDASIPVGDREDLVKAINYTKTHATDASTLGGQPASYYAQSSDVLELQRENAHLLAYADIDGRALGNTGKFVDLMDGHSYTYNAGKIDTTKSNATTSLSIGATSITVSSATGFAVGQEITVFDDVNLERPTITAIASNTLTVTALTKAYKSGATVCRSSVVVDTVNKCLKFGGWSSTATYTRTGVSVVGSAYDTSGNGGRKLVRLSNGWLVAGVRDTSTNKIMFYKSADNGATWSALTFTRNATASFAIASNGTTVNVFYNDGAYVYFVKFDATTVTNTDQYDGSSLKVVETQTAMQSVSLTIDSNGKLWATWASKNSTYPNSFNIRVSSSTDGTTWASPTQVTADNTSGTDNTNPCVVITSSNNPVFIHQRVAGTTYYIYSRYYNVSNSSWNGPYTVYTVASYTQSNPSAVVDSSGVIHVAWQGYDSTDVNPTNIRYSKSTDGGATWSAMLKLTSGNVSGQGQYYPSITADKNNNVYVLWRGIDSAVNATYNQIRKIVWNGSAWGSITTITSNTTGDAVNPSTLANYTDFTDPLTIYMDNVAGAVKFRGVWSDTSNTPVLVEDVRYNITPPSNATELVAWVDHDTDANYTVAGALSLVASVANESYASMTKSSQNLAGNITEDQFYGNVATAQPKGTLRLTLTRNATTNTSNVKKILGAVS